MAYLVYAFLSQFNIRLGQESGGRRRQKAQKSAVPSLLNLLSYKTGTISSGMAPPTLGQALLHHIDHCDSLTRYGTLQTPVFECLATGNDTIRKYGRNGVCVTFLEKMCYCRGHSTMPSEAVHFLLLADSDIELSAPSASPCLHACCLVSYHDDNG